MSILVEGLTKEYSKQKAVNNISFEVKKGEILGFLGPNGAGKTTTMKIITGYLSPTSGKVLIDNKDISEDDGSIKNKIGYLPESNPLYSDMPMVDYIKFFGNLQGLKGDLLNKRVKEMIVACGLSPEKHKKINELSKGYRQRVGLAAAMIHDPEILILDEPTSGLDPNQIIEIRKLIKRLGKEKTVILSTHILQEVEATCTRILIINQGKIVADGTADTLRKQSEGVEILNIKIEDAEYSNLVQALESISTIGLIKTINMSENKFEIQSRHGLSSKRDIFNMCVQNNWLLSELTPIEDKLEDIFRNLTKN